MYAGAPVEYGAVDEVFERRRPPVHAGSHRRGSSARRRARRRRSRRSRACFRGPTRSRRAAASRRAAGSRATREICRTERPAFELDRPRPSRRLPLRRRVARDGRRDPRAGGLTRRAVDRLDAPRRATTSRRTTAPAAVAALASAGSGPSRACRSRSVAASRSASSASPGSGKSTVARLLLGLTERTRGEVTFEGRPLEASIAGLAKEQRGRVQMVFQDPGDSLNPLMTVEQIVAEPLLLLRTRRGARRHRGRVPELLELVGSRRRLRQAAASPALRWAAAARCDRPSACDRPRARRLRRGGVVARRLRARADPQPPDGPPAPPRALVPLHLARSLHRAARLRPRRRDVRRPVRRSRRRRRHLHGPPAPLHRRPALGRADPEPGARARAAPDQARR